MLNQDEIDQIIASLAAGQSSADETTVDHVPSQPVDSKSQMRVRVYDFRRPDKFSKEQMRTVQMLHENFARHLTGFLSGKLRTMVQASVISVDQMTYQEFVKGLSNPGVIGVMVVEPLEGKAIIEMTPSLALPLIDRLFGGPGQPTWVTRPITDIEQTVLERIISGMLEVYKETWKNVAEMLPKLESIQTNPLFTQVIAPNEMVLVVSIETKFGEFAGGINLCIPYITIEAFLPALSTHRWFSRSVDSSALPANAKNLGKRLDKIEVNATAELGRAKVVVREVLGLTVGDVIVLNTKVKDDIKVLVSGRPKFLGKLGRSGARYAVQVTGVLEDWEEVE